MNVFLPVAVLAGHTLFVAGLVGFHRVRAGVRRRVDVGDFRVGESANVPEDVRLPNRNLINLFEMPVLFYLAAIVAHLSASVDELGVILAWVYVALRIAHSIVHLTYNKVPHRIAAYASSNVLLAVIWFRLGYALLQKS